jgi:hypothetical protein
MNNNKRRIALALLAILGMNGAAEAALVNNGGGLIYDTTLNATWLSNANYAGWLGFNDATSFASTLNFNGITGWSLPTSDTCTNMNCSNSQMGELFYNELGGVAGSSIYTTHNANYGLFQNIQSRGYASSTTANGDPSYGYMFYFDSGTVSGIQEVNYRYSYGQTNPIMFIHSGDVGGNISAVPEPEEYGMMLAGLGLIGFMVHRRKKSDSSNMMFMAA